MKKFRVFYLRGSKLERAETLNRRDVLDVIDHATKRPPDVTAEIWCERGKIGIVGPSPSVQDHKSEHRGVERNAESQIAEIMKSRLQLRR